MTDNEVTDDELDEELDKAFRENEAKKDQCGKPMPSSRETGVQRTNVKLKKE